jgi:IS30 family transposase
MKAHLGVDTEQKVIHSVVGTAANVADSAVLPDLLRTSQAASDTMISLLSPFAACVHTLTTDSGKAFAQHERIAGTLDAKFFFAHPYAFWERGANEIMDGLIRQFFPKWMRFESITHKDIQFAMHSLANTVGLVARFRTCCTSDSQGGA